MINFLIKGLVRDPSRSFFPVMVVACGVALTVLLHSWINGVGSDFVDTSAKLQSGHMKITTRSYAKLRHQNPNDLGVVGINKLLSELKQEMPLIKWQPRIQFGGLLDFADEQGETLEQAPVMGMGVDLFSKGSWETKNLNLAESLVQGVLPKQPNEILISDELFKKLKLKLGQPATLLGSTMDGSMAVHNFKVVGTIRFGVTMMDRGAMVADLKDVQWALNMEDAASEILGYINSGEYDDHTVKNLKKYFNRKYSKENDPFSPEMMTLKEQSDFGQMLDLLDYATFLVSSFFIALMSIILWNAGLMASIRRYGEMGLRLALGEHKLKIYLSLIVEAFFVGLAGAILGTLLGLIPAYIIQEVGVNIGDYMQGSSMMISDTLRTKISFTTCWIGLIPGTLSTLFGTMISGLAIFKRETAQLFKELEV